LAATRDAFAAQAVETLRKALATGEVSRQDALVILRAHPNLVDLLREKDEFKELLSEVEKK
jgi:hypothetical protein